MAKVNLDIGCGQRKTPNSIGVDIIKIKRALFSASGICDSKTKAKHFYKVIKNLT
jgi:hypothetical protein